MNGKKRIMLIDDEEDFLRITKLNLEKTKKYEVFALSKAKEALSCVRSFRPDVILLDMLMPKTGGVDICKELNRDPLGRNIPVIIVSALDRDADKLRAYENGVVDYLVKPAELNKIVTAIDKVFCGQTIGKRIKTEVNYE